MRRKATSRGAWSIWLVAWNAPDMRPFRVATSSSVPRVIRPIALSAKGLRIIIMPSLRHSAVAWPMRDFSTVQTRSKKRGSTEATIKPANAPSMKSDREAGMNHSPELRE